MQSKQNMWNIDCIWWYDMIVDIVSDKKPNLIVIELLIRGRKLNISLGFIS